MQLIRYIDKKCILFPPAITDWDSLIPMLCNAALHSKAVSAVEGVTREVICDAVLERENEGSTFLGKDFLFPHARLHHINSPAIVIAILPKPIPYCNQPSQQIRLACLLLVPDHMPTLALKISAQLSQLFSDTAIRARIDAARTPEALYDILRETDLSLDIPITARDIMQPPVREIYPETSLKAVTRIMRANGSNTVGVVDHEGRLLGQITADRLFHFGLPEFFGQLKSVAFISGFDPFERYFNEEGNSCAKDLMTTDHAVLPPSGTLLEIVFALTTLKAPMVFIVDNGQFVGVIGKGTVVDRIINL